MKFIMTSFNMYYKGVLTNFCIIDFATYIYYAYSPFGNNTAYFACLDSTYRQFMCRARSSSKRSK